jgi:para-aminobenzoate synthetase component 1
MPYRSRSIPELPPFQGGLAGLFGYGLGNAIESLPQPRIDEFQVPDVAVGIYDWVVAFDHAQNRAWLLAHDPKRMHDVRNVLHHRPSATILEKTSLAIDRLEISPACRFPLPGHLDVASNFDRTGYLKMIRAAVDYVHAGDCFQVNLSQRLLTPMNEPALSLYGRLRERNPAPFGGFFDLGDFAVASASPERFIRVEDGCVETRPIKGTRPRGNNSREEEAIIRELELSAKDRAENVMIVDLLRNDLGRVCEYGSIRVPEVCRVESYRYVHHLVSQVTGKLRPDKTPLDLLRATFPGGSVTGAPKVRAMQIIAELEPTTRGPYCGSLGYIGFDGAMDLNILIRTFAIGKGWVQFPVGGGIVADSDPEREYEETLHKAAGLLKAL